MPDLDRLAHHQLACATDLSGQPSPSFTLRISAAQRPRKIAPRHHIAQVIIQLVRAATRFLRPSSDLSTTTVRPICQRLVIVLQSHRAQKSCRPVEILLQFLGLHGAQLRRAHRAQQLGLVHLVVAAQKRRHAMPRIGLSLPRRASAPCTPRT